MAGWDAFGQPAVDKRLAETLLKCPAPHSKLLLHTASLLLVHYIRAEMQRRHSAKVWGHAVANLARAEAAAPYNLIAVPRCTLCACPKLFRSWSMQQQL